MADDQQRITLHPANPVQGQQVEICYDFAGSGLDKTTLRVTFSPDGAPTDHRVTDQAPCVTIGVPAKATSILVEDLDGPSPDAGAIVVPP